MQAGAESKGIAVSSLLLAAAWATPGYRCSATPLPSNPCFAASLDSDMQ